MRSADRPSPRTGLILLAAGGSTRLGSPKQLLPFGRRTLLRHVAEVAITSGCIPIVVVLGANVTQMRPELDGLDVEIAVNDTWEEGMASSLRCGIAAVAPAEVHAVVILLCDQPLVTAATIGALQLAGADTTKRAIVSRYASGETGPPCLFKRSLFSALSELRGAQGAKVVLRKLPDAEIGGIAFPEGRFDVDTWEDWRRLGAEIKSG